MTKRLILGMLGRAPVGVGVLLVLAAVTVLFLAACEVEEEVDVTDAPTREASPTATPVNLDPGKAQKAMEADRAKPRFRGEVGDFVVVEPKTAYPCPGPDQPLLNLEQSELPFEFPGAVADKAGTESCQGAVMSISDDGGTTLVGRSYFLGPKLNISFDAPAERLKLLTTVTRTLYGSGNAPWATPVPAIAMLPIPDCISCVSEVVATYDGIAVWAQSDSLDKAKALVQQIIDAQPYPRTHPPLDINGVWLPLPPGADRTVLIVDPGPDPEGPNLGTSRGRSQIWWNKSGVTDVRIAPEDEADFQPFLEGLKKAFSMTRGG